MERVNREYIEKVGKAWDGIDKEAKDFTVKFRTQIISLTKEEAEKWTNAAKPLLDE